MSNYKTIVTSIKNVSPVLTELLSEGAAVKFIVTGNSMYPMLRSKVDTVILRKKDAYKKYDIALYQRENGDYVLHRIVKARKDIMHMAGDFETEIEYPIYEAQLIAAVEGFYRNGRYISCRNPVYRLYSLLWSLVIPKRHAIVEALKRMKYAVGRRRW